MHPRFRTKNWYEEFWKSQPDAYGTATDSLIKQIEFIAANCNTVEKTALDIACGNGRYLHALEKAGFEVFATDIAESAVLLAQKQSSSATIKRSNYIIESPFEDEKFDLIFSSGYIDELNPKEQLIVLSKMQTMTKNGGHILLKYCIEIQNRGTQVKDKFIPHYFEEAGWQIISTDEEQNLRRYPQGIPNEGAVRTGTIIIKKNA